MTCPTPPSPAAMAREKSAQLELERLKDSLVQLQKRSAAHLKSVTNDTKNEAFVIIYNDMKATLKHLVGDLPEPQTLNNPPPRRP